MSSRRKTISIRDVSSIIKSNLQKAVKILSEVNAEKLKSLNQS